MFVLFCSWGAWCCGELFAFVVVCGLVGLVLGCLVLIAAGLIDCCNVAGLC